MPGCCNIGGRAYLSIWGSSSAKLRQATRPALIYYDMLTLDGAPLSDSASEAVSHEIVRYPPSFPFVRHGPV